jgi:CHAT domain-containing protein
VGSETLASRAAGNLQLAVLSACDTAGNAEGAGRSETLSRALLRAGVPRVIASLWNVDSAQTANFMKVFYAQLLAGNNAANSIHTAELALASQPVSAHPYYWSAFELEGSR